MERPTRRLVTRACAVCEWENAAVETDDRAVDCPWCHGPTRVLREEWLVNPALLKARAVAFGRQGGLKGGRTRAERLSASRRKEIARAAARARWRRQKSK